METNTLVWKIYKLLFLNIWHHQFFYSKIKPQDVDLQGEKLKEYLNELNLNIKGFNYQDNSEVNFSTNQPVTLFYADHPSSLDALFFFSLLEKVNPFFVSFLHNKLHFKFLSQRIIPVASYFKAEQLNLLGMKLKFGRRLENMTKSQAREMNRQVVPKAVRELSKGHSVMIFPSGGWGEWQDGIGFIVSQFSIKHPDKELILQPLKMNSFGEFHSVLHSLLHFLKIKVKAIVKIKVGPKLLLSEFSKKSIFEIKDEKKRSKAIRNYLEDSYREL